MMKNVFFKPFVGKQYGKQGYEGVKLLILGDSHYCSDECPNCGQLEGNECSNFTKDVVSRYLNFKKGLCESSNWMSTYTRFTNVLLGEKVDNNSVIKFWESIMFYNYVQSTVGGARTSPSRQQYEESEKAFMEVLKKYKPDLIIVWGARLWEYLPDIGKYGEERKIYGANDSLYYYKVGDKEIPAFSVYHPSSSDFSYADSRKIQKAISMVKETQLS